ncbi:7534a6df-f22f-40ae-8475-15f5105bb5e2 [Thermothielavioides terrestris]|uniref:7534a6df-f22f-40ae-8475-15f5105bb5e2 n=1 Tax=Thermothielavioides terrestris TaxID=2587410 RepID=A0A446BXD0_9PEZI|nr:7534a6df-f22f-40ae-8475-15f5105bb5e2 [Thermothielavioides terrestris]
MSPPGKDADAAAVEGLLRNLAAAPSVQRLSAVALNNAILREENDKLSKENSAAADMIHRVQTQLNSAKAELSKKADELEKVKEEKAALARKLAEVKDQLVQSEMNIKDLKDSFDTKQRSLEERAKDAEAELRGLKELSVKLRPVDEATTKKISECLQAVSSAACKLAGDFFGVNLPKDILDNRAVWSRIITHNSNSAKIPLPLSNSHCGKQMRAALLISVLGYELHKHIFQPTYLVKDVGLNKVLRTLAENEPDLESHLRSVLLAASEKARETNQRVYEVATNSILELVSPAVPQDSREAFQAELQELCATAFEKWQVIQALEDHVVPEFGDNRLSEPRGEWIPLTFKTTFAQQRANGTASAQGQATKNTPAAAPQAQPDTAADLLDGIAVWPAFYNLSSGDDETLAKGIILPPSLLKAAKAEEQATASTPRSPSSQLRRDLRDQERSSNSRRRRQSLVSGIGQADAGKQTGSFLSNGSSAGLNGA